MKSSLKKLMSTFSDMGSVRDEPHDLLDSKDDVGSLTSTKRSFSFLGRSRKESKRKKEIIKLLSEHNLYLQERLQDLLGTNTEVRVEAALQLDEERRLRQEAEARILEAKLKREEAEQALLAAEDEKACLEAELLEAASDILSSRAFCRAYEEKIEADDAILNLLQQREQERNELEQKLKGSEMQRLNLLRSIVALRQTVQTAERSVRTAEMQQTMSPVGGDVEEMHRAQRNSLEPILEYEGEFEHEGEEMGPSSRIQEQEGDYKAQNGFSFSDRRDHRFDEAHDEEMSYRSSSSVVWPESRGEEHPFKFIQDAEYSHVVPLVDQDLNSEASDGSLDSLLSIPPGLITVGDYITEAH